MKLTIFKDGQPLQQDVEVTEFKRVIRDDARNDKWATTQSVYEVFDRARFLRAYRWILAQVRPI